MGKKIALNVFYNLILIVSVIGAAWSYQNRSPLIIAFFGAIFVMILYFKIQLIKAIKKETGTK
jgi:hypothetical protein